MLTVGWSSREEQEGADEEGLLLTGREDAI